MRLNPLTYDGDTCPKCDSTNICVGAFPLECLDCGWCYLNDRPCSTCGGPSFGVVGVGGKVVYGCKAHPASLRILGEGLAKILQDNHV